VDGADEAALIPLSALQHYLYCDRQCALIHVDGLWAENRLTVEGRHLHEGVDSDTHSRRGGVRTVRGLRIRSLRLGIVGRADVVEFSTTGPPRPIEYKRGRPKQVDADRVQLCAQALCLEEMLGAQIPEGDLFYGRTRRREKVALSEALRAKTEATISSLRTLVDSGTTPRAEYAKRKCDNCSLKDLCLPKGTGPSRSPSRYLARALEASLAEVAPESEPGE
jgi:CRISPR-associated exonuclease Cas4